MKRPSRGALTSTAEPFFPCSRDFPPRFDLGFRAGNNHFLRAMSGRTGRDDVSYCATDYSANAETRHSGWRVQFLRQPGPYEFPAHHAPFDIPDFPRLVPGLLAALRFAQLRIRTSGTSWGRKCTTSEIAEDSGRGPSVRHWAQATIRLAASRAQGRAAGRPQPAHVLLHGGRRKDQKKTRQWSRVPPALGCRATAPGIPKRSGRALGAPFCP
jgi:hypothetical protein